MTQYWVGSGWKMNHLIKESIEYAEALKDFVEEEKPKSNIFICVPYTVLNLVSEILSDSGVFVAAQNSHWLDRGPVTGEISPMMIKDAGATMVEIGHSERRESFGEDDIIINKKIKASLSHNLKPILCIGETWQEKDFDISIEILNKQLKIALHNLSPQQICELLIAYEPVWAIGDSGIPAKPQYIEYVLSNIQNTLCEIIGSEKGRKIPLLYGGSVNFENAHSFISLSNVSGLFIGRSAWDVDGMKRLIRIVETHYQ